MNTDPVPPAGPILHATLLVHDVAPLVAGYAQLGLVVLAEGVVAERQVQAWGAAAAGLAGRRWVALAPPGSGSMLLQLIVVPGAAPRPTRRQHGWLALEILVRDVDALAVTLAAAPDPGHFEIVGPPADLDVSPAIRAMQVVGPAGEMLYLTQVKAPVPPFDVPLSAAIPATAQLGALFIAVMSTPSREAAVASCASLAPGAVLRFETKITVLNRALGHPVEHRWPVATLQWSGASLFEIDEVVDTGVGPATPAAGTALPAGLAWITMAGPAAGSPRLFEISPGAWLECVPGAAPG